MAYMIVRFSFAAAGSVKSYSAVAFVRKLHRAPLVRKDTIPHASIAWLDYYTKNLFEDRQKVGLSELRPVKKPTGYYSSVYRRAAIKTAIEKLSETYGTRPYSSIRKNWKRTVAHQQWYSSCNSNCIMQVKDTIPGYPITRFADTLWRVKEINPSPGHDSIT